MKQRSPSLNSFPLKMVGSTVFGRYPKISAEQTFNMFISDGWLVPYAGYKKVVNIGGGEGRGIFNSTRAGKLIAVIDNNVYSIDQSMYANVVATIETSSGDVFIDENDNHEIAICDKKNIYIYNYIAATFTKAVLPFTPIYVCFQDGYFIAPAAPRDTVPGDNPRWYLSNLNNGLVWNALDYGTFQTKPDNIVACVRLPSRGNQLFVMGSIVTESWTDVGYKLFPYQRSSGYNIDYGCANPATIASGDNFIVWLGINEKSGPVIMYSSGGEVSQISNDGINFRLAHLNSPNEAYGFLFKQDGHLFYQLTFTDPKDNLTLAYDFTAQRFYTLTDHQMNYHIAKRMTFYNNSYFFVSFADGNIYEMSSLYTTYDGDEIPRVRVLETYRMPDSSPFVVNNLTFTLEQGMDSYLPYQEPQEAKGSISSSTDFPLKTHVNVGDYYIITSVGQIVDDQPTRTYTHQYFTTGDKIVWNGNNWDKITDNTGAIDLSVSRDGGVSYGSSKRIVMNRLGHRQNRVVVWSLGYANEFTPQFRFWGMGRFVLADGQLSIFQ